MKKMVLMSRKPTGRDWGDKVAEKRNGDIVTNDAWEGPIEAGERGEYYRCTWREVTYAI